MEWVFYIGVPLLFILVLFWMSTIWGGQWFEWERKFDYRKRRRYVDKEIRRMRKENKAVSEV